MKDVRRRFTLSTVAAGRRSRSKSAAAAAVAFIDVLVRLMAGRPARPAFTPSPPASHLPAGHVTAALIDTLVVGGLSTPHDLDTATVSAWPGGVVVHR